VKNPVTISQFLAIGDEVGNSAQRHRTASESHEWPTCTIAIRSHIDNEWLAMTLQYALQRTQNWSHCSVTRDNLGGYPGEEDWIDVDATPSATPTPLPGITVHWESAELGSEVFIALRVVELGAMLHSGRSLPKGDPKDLIVIEIGRGPV